VNNLSQQSCSACEIGAPLVPKDQIDILLTTLDGWSVEELNIEKLIKQYTFQSYKQASIFLSLIVNLAESEDHHPKITLEWGLVTLEWWSHKIKGLHMNDFICAAKSDEIFRSL
jgi:4a-hydroxytetrahydrobiopterin dehydratase